LLFINKCIVLPLTLTCLSATGNCINHTPRGVHGVVLEVPSHISSTSWRPEHPSN